LSSPGRTGELRVTESLPAAGVCCSRWFGPTRSRLWWQERVTDRSPEQRDQLGHLGVERLLTLSGRFRPTRRESLLEPPLGDDAEDVGRRNQRRVLSRQCTCPRGQGDRLRQAPVDAAI